MHYWLLKSEPTDYSIDDLSRDSRDWWTGVRNYQARNFMMRDMNIGDEALFYHSTCAAPGVYGIARICDVARADATQFDVDSKYYDSKSTAQNPRWHCVQVEFVKKLSVPLLLADMRQMSALADMLILKRGNRLSITPVSAKHWRLITKR